MNTKYIDLIEQTFDFPQEEFKTINHKLFWHGINLMELAEKYGAPLKFNYLPKISENIQKAKGWFNNSIKKHNYKGKYFYSYCTKSAHFKHILYEALKNEIHIETSSAFDIDIVKKLKLEGKIKDTTYVICNGFKRDQYIKNIISFKNARGETIKAIEVKTLTTNYLIKISIKLQEAMEEYSDDEDFFQDNEDFEVNLPEGEG